MESKTFSIKNIMALLVTLLLAFASFFTLSSVKADSVIKDYSNGGYVESIYGQTILLNMPDGTKGQDRSNWKKRTVQSGDKLGGWYRINYVYDYSEEMFFNVYVDINGEKTLNTIGYIGKYNMIMFSGFGVECELTKVNNVNCVEFFIPYDLSVNFISNGTSKTLTLQDYSTVIPYSGIGAYKLTDETNTEGKTTLNNLKIGSTDTLNRSDYITIDKDVYSLSNTWFRFKKPNTVFTTTSDIAIVKTTLDNESYEAKLHYVIDDNGNKSLMLGRFNVAYNVVDIKGEEYIEFCIPKGKIVYFNTKESVLEHTLNVGIMDSIKPIDESFVRLEYNLVEAFKKDVETVSPYTPILAVCAVIMLISGIFIVFTHVFPKKKNKNKE